MYPQILQATSKPCMYPQQVTSVNVVELMAGEEDSEVQLEVSDIVLLFNIQLTVNLP
jgi:hypothetical protein